jgi:nitroreductase
MSKQAQSQHPIHELIAARWSPYGFDARELTRQDLAALFEAARWAPSSYNAQPWRYIAAVRGEPAFARILQCLWDANQAWARYAPLLALGLVQTGFAHNGQPNAAAEHDLGLASATLSLEASARGIAVHQMIGLHGERVIEEFAVPAGFKPLTALAIGYPGTPPGLAAEILARDTRARERLPLNAFVFGGAWGEGAEFGN